MMVSRVHHCHLSSTRVRPLQSLSSSDVIFVRSVNQSGYDGSSPEPATSNEHQRTAIERFLILFAKPVYHGVVLAIYKSFKGRAVLETDLSPGHKLIYVLPYTLLPFVPCHRGVPVVANHTLCLSNVWSSI